MPKATILIVEDEAIVAEDLFQKLGHMGYEVRGITALGEEAVALARDRRPDLVLMDIRLRGRMGGIEAAELIRRECDLPVVFLTGQADSATLQRAKVTDRFGYILKPFDELELETHIDMALHKHQTESKLRQNGAVGD
jgi:AmiR/NasT family two-component response regulator